MHRLKDSLLIAGLVAASLALPGCGQAPAPGPAEKPSAAKGHADHDHDHDDGDDDHEHAHAGKKHDHSGWWCDEHGVPEEECGLCNSKLAADMQKKGDWCKEHDRPDSQCFTCHPELEEKFAALYEAKYGKKPPKPVE